MAYFDRDCSLSFYIFFFFLANTCSKTFVDLQVCKIALFSKFIQCELQQYHHQWEACNQEKDEKEKTLKDYLLVVLCWYILRP